LAAKNDCPADTPDRLFDSARLTPVAEDARLVGWSVTEIKPGSPWEKLGLKSKDLIVKVDGQRPADAAEFLARIKRFCAKGFTLEIQRQGASLVLKRS